MTRRGWLVMLVLAFVLVLVAELTLDLPSETQIRELDNSSQVEVADPEEDEPGFDCRLHGNKRCGKLAGT